MLSNLENKNLQPKNCFKIRRPKLRVKNVLSNLEKQNLHYASMALLTTLKHKQLIGPRIPDAAVRFIKRTIELFKKGEGRINAYFKKKNDKKILQLENILILYDFLISTS